MAGAGRVIVFQHAQRLCALPTAHVRSVRNTAPDMPGALELRLWPLPAVPETGDVADRWAELSVVAPASFLRCSEPRIIALKRSTTWPLSTLLSSVIGLPYVVGISQTELGDAWLVDLLRPDVDRRSLIVEPDR